MADVLSVINPATEQIIKDIPVNDPAAVSEKVANARAAQPKWAARPIEERIDVLKRFKHLLIEQADT
ncbi:MAG: aldehyde dehydrogenase family protein, partial [Cyanobacteria bacterium P01_F01_bin.3]